MVDRILYGTVSYDVDIRRLVVAVIGVGGKAAVTRLVDGRSVAFLYSFSRSRLVPSRRVKTQSSLSHLVVPLVPEVETELRMLADTCRRLRTVTIPFLATFRCRLVLLRRETGSPLPLLLSSSSRFKPASCLLLNRKLLFACRL